MKYKVPGKCSICGHDIIITNFSCPQCKTKTEGEFTPCMFCALKPEQLDFVQTFLKCRGSMKDMEKELGISYPTIRNRLEETLQVLGLSASAGSEEDKVNVEVEETEKDSGKRRVSADILTALEKGEVTPQEALSRLKEKVKR